LNDRSQLTFWEHSNKWHQKLRQPQNIIWNQIFIA
jgi:hypothetical protein